MKFDTVIGNPPYQGADGQSQIYPKFCIKALEISKRHTALIIPTRWYNGNTEELNKFRREILNNGLKELVDYTNSEDVFNNVQIMGGICYYHTDKEYSGDVKVTNNRKSTKTISTRPVTLSNSDIIIRDNVAIDILNKVNPRDNSFDFYVKTKDIFKIPSTNKGSVIETSDTIPVYVTGNSSAYRGGNQIFS